MTYYAMTIRLVNLIPTINEHISNWYQIQRGLPILNYDYNCILEYIIDEL